MRQTSPIALACLILGIMSLFFGWIPVLGWILAVGVIIGGIIAMHTISKRHEGGEWMAVTAIVLGIISLFLSLIVFGSILYAGSQDDADAAPEPPVDYDYGDFSVYYDPVAEDSHLFMERHFRETAWFEQNAEKLNTQFILPANVTVVFAECGTANAWYDPRALTITMCYELADVILQSFYENYDDVDVVFAKWLNAMDFIFYHELGHALIHLYDLPITGREEDVADQMSMFIMSETWEGGEEAALDGAQFFYFGSVADQTPFWDSHSLNDQRVYNMICWLFGRDPGRFAHLVPEVLPQERGIACPDEYEKIDQAMHTLLDPYRK